MLITKSSCKRFSSEKFPFPEVTEAKEGSLNGRLHQLSCCVIISDKFKSIIVWCSIFCLVLRHHDGDLDEYEGIVEDDETDVHDEKDEKDDEEDGPPRLGL